MATNLARGAPAKPADIADWLTHEYGREGRESLGVVSAIFGLNKTETARLFGVTRQAIDAWYAHGMPSERCAQVARLRDLAQAMCERFKPERLPEIVRSSLPGLEGRSILDTIRAVGTVPIFDLLDRAFSYLPR